MKNIQGDEVLMDIVGLEKYKYIEPFSDEAELTCRSVKIVKARKEHQCYSLDGEQDHMIEKGEFYRYEKALVDSDFWGEYKLCIKCCEKFYRGEF